MSTHFDEVPQIPSFPKNRPFKGFLLFAIILLSFGYVLYRAGYFRNMGSISLVSFQPTPSPVIENVIPTPVPDSFTDSVHGIQISSLSPLVPISKDQDGSYIPLCDGGSNMSACYIYNTNKTTPEQTGFEGASLGVYALTGVASSSCLTYQDTGDPVKGMEIINGNTFAQASRAGIAAGHGRMDYVWRALNGQTCVEVVMRVTGETQALDSLTRPDSSILLQLKKVLNTISFFTP